MGRGMLGPPEGEPVAPQGAPTPASVSAEPKKDAGALRALYGVRVVIVGLAVVLIAFIFAVIFFRANAADVSTALAPITGVIGTIVGAYFGVQVGASGKEEAEIGRTKAEDDAKALAAVAPAGPAAAVLGFNPADLAVGRSDEPPLSRR